MFVSTSGVYRVERQAIAWWKYHFGPKKQDVRKLPMLPLKLEMVWEPRLGRDLIEALG